MAAKTFIEEDAEQLRRLEQYRKLVWVVVQRHYRALLIVFATITCGMMAMYWLNVRLADDRYEAGSALFFYSKQTELIKAMDVRQGFEIFSRRSMMPLLTESMGLPPEKAGSLHRRITINYDKNKPNLVALSARGATVEEALALVNSFADLCVSEYLRFRSQDLQNSQVVLIARKSELNNAIQEYEKEAAALMKALDSVAPGMEAERLRKTLTEQKTLLSEINVQIANEKSRKEKLDEQLKNIHPAVSRYAARLKDMIAEIERLNKEVVRLETVYTGRNPKLIAAQSELATAEKKYQDFMESKEITDFDADTLHEVDTINSVMTQVVNALETFGENRAALVAEIENNERHVARIAEKLPRYNEITHQRELLHQSLQNVEASLDETRFLLASFGNDVMQVERATNASAKTPFSRRNIVITLIMAIMGTGIAGTMVVLNGIIFGKVESQEELELFDELVPLGAYHIALSTPEGEKNMLEKIAYRFQAIKPSRRIVFGGCLLGAETKEPIDGMLAWSCAMEGSRVILLNVVPAITFKGDTEPTARFGAIIIRDAVAEMPVKNVFALSKAELELLINDIQLLLEEYDMVVINRAESIPQDDIFFQQMLDLSDCAILYVGERSTPRKLLRHVVDLQRKGNYTIMTILTGVDSEAPSVIGE